MARVLFAPETFNLGETTRGVEVAAALRARGHETVFMGYSTRFADYVRQAGFDLHLLDPELSDADADRLIAVDQGRALRHPFTVAMLQSRVHSELGLIRRWRPDAIVIGSTLSMFLSARAAGVPLGYIKPYAMSASHLDSLTELPLVAGRSRAGRAVNRTAGRLARRVAAASTWKPRAFRVVAERLGVRLPARTSDALDADLNLIASLFPALDRRPLASRDVAVGPIYATRDAPMPPRVAALVDRERPAVYVGMGSSANRRLAAAILDHVASCDVEVVSSVGRYLDETDRARLGGNVQCYDFLPAHRLGGLIDASVIHGGEGTVLTACASGVPFAGIGLQLEQRWNLDECVRYGNALRFTARDVRAGRIGQLVRRLLRDLDLARAARTLQRAAAGLDGPSECARHIERLMGQSPGTWGR